MQCNDAALLNYSNDVNRRETLKKKSKQELREFFFLTKSSSLKCKTNQDSDFPKLFRNTLQYQCYSFLNERETIQLLTFILSHMRSAVKLTVVSWSKAENVINAVLSVYWVIGEGDRAVFEWCFLKLMFFCLCRWIPSSWGTCALPRNTTRKGWRNSPSREQRNKHVGDLCVQILFIPSTIKL